jgi:hypothetical protein
MMARRVFSRSVQLDLAVVSSAAVVTVGLLLGLAGSVGAATTGIPVTCFAIDVSGSNLYASDGEPPSDPGPVFVRQQVVELYSEILADYSQTAGQRVGVVTFGTDTGTEIGPLAISGPATLPQLQTVLSRALRPSAAEAAWTNWVAGVRGCEQMFQRSGTTHGTVAVLTDGFPQGPAGDPAQQLAAIAPMARKLWSQGITIQPVLYGAGAAQQGQARQAMTELAALGHGQLVLAATALDMLRSAISLASLTTGLELGGSEISVNGFSSVDLEIPAQIMTAVTVVLRDSDQVQISVTAPGGKTLSAAAAGSGTLGLVAALSRPTAGSYLVSAQGQGSVFAAELLHYDNVPAPSRTPSRSPHQLQSRRAAGSSLAWLLILGLALLVIAAVLSWWIIARRRRPKGTLVVWRGPDQRTLDPLELRGRGRVDLAELVGTDPDPTGWSVEWTRQAPIVTDSDRVVTRLLARETKIADITPPATFTWLPDGSDVFDEPPGRPASTVP